MSRIAKHALLPSLLATAFAAPAPAAAPQTRVPGATCARTAPARCPSCAREAVAAVTVRDLLADGSAIDATRNAVRSILGLAPEDAEEAAQEAALRAVKKDVPACCPSGLQRWMFRTAKNFVLDGRRKKREVLFSAHAPDGPDDRPMTVGTSSDLGPLDVLQLQDEVDSTLNREDLTELSPEKRVHLGRALGDRLQSDQAAPRYLPRASALVDHARAAVRGLAPRS